MKRLVVVLAAAALLGGCSSAAAPGADNVVNQVDKAKQAGELVDRHNSDLDEVCADPSSC